MGAVTRVEYAPSTRFYLEDQQRPETRWRTTAAVPGAGRGPGRGHRRASQAASSTTEYRYHHGYWDGAEREFRGFGRVDQRDTESSRIYHAAGLHAGTGPLSQFQRTPFSPPTETRTWFHQGPIGEEFGEWEEAGLQRVNTGRTIRRCSRGRKRSSTCSKPARAAPRTRCAPCACGAAFCAPSCMPWTARNGRIGPTPSPSRLWRAREKRHRVRRRRSGPVSSSRTWAQRTTQWERGDDPMTQFAFTERLR